MIDLSPEAIAVLMIGGVLLGVLSGFPLALVVGSVGFIVGYLTLGSPAVGIIYTRLYSLSLNYTLLAVPLFTFMGVMLERSGISSKLYDSLYLWLGGFRGGLAVATVIFGTILAACLGVIAASVTMLTCIALTPMIKKGYDRSLASGVVCAGGSLGILIPPSVMLVIYGPMASVSVGKLFMGAIFPGFLLSILYCAYIAIRGVRHPESCPAIPAGAPERKISFSKKTVMLITSMAPPLVLIIAVLGSIFLGIAPPTEAAAVGAFAVFLLTVGYRKFSWGLLKYTSLETMRVSSFVLLIGCLSFTFVGIFIGAGCADVVSNVVMAAPFGRWGAFAAVMLIVFILGMFIDWIGIVFIMVPIIAPIATTLGFDPLWFAIMVCINFQMSFMTPPFALSIFVCKGTAASELGLTMHEIIRGVIPFVLLIILCLGLCIIFPQIILWLPGKMVTGFK